MHAQPPAREELEEAVAGAAAGRPEVAAAYLYGTAAAERTTPLSDVDVAVLFREEAADPRAGRGVLSEIVGELARRLPGVSFDVRDLERLPLSVQGRVLTEGSLLVDSCTSTPGWTMRGSTASSARTWEDLDRFASAVLSAFPELDGAGSGRSGPGDRR